MIDHLRILLVDDNPQDRQLVVRELRQVFPNVEILSDPYADEASCRKEIVSDKDSIFDCAAIMSAGTSMLVCCRLLL